MGILRLPRPAGIYIPSTTRTVTTDMISPPMSPDADFDFETLVPSARSALQYISRKLQQKAMHLTMLVGWEKPFPTGQSSDLTVIPVTALDRESRKTLERIIEKASRKFSLGQSWVDALAAGQLQRHSNEYIIEQSLRQNEILFSEEGLTLLSIDRVYMLKRRLCMLSHGTTRIPEETYISSCVHLLRQTIKHLQGRPFSKAFFHRVYDHLDVSDQVLVKVADAYRTKYRQDGIVFQRVHQKQECQRRSPFRGPRVGRRQQQPIPPRSGTPLRRGPTTPVSASDVTPITRNEWNILIGPEFHQNERTVTMWIPSPEMAVR
ncbi:hypothetical protein C8Q69DRAFT_505493 [Paecilomyces variotii]|uniref:DUF7582 domain-containing protein n=1 Tax=Byssochlamys spectabilis TaxID=264951 RepID=A0A443HXY1_BYSSP|nr:hypothetical protein C8Q69DRAFT_505493 [Paecilomyces variotii]RWQ96604.1 hypothetical protein C8Q69DRAFT_505493 [Paecilomyces variotii]